MRALRLRAEQQLSAAERSSPGITDKSVTPLPGLRRRPALFSVEQQPANPHGTREDMVKKALQLAQILQHGIAAHRQGQLAEAERSYQAVLAAKRDDFDSLHLL